MPKRVRARAKGKQGPRGQRGLRGLRGLPGIAPAKIAALTNTIESMHADAELQFKRIAQLQAELDAALRALSEL